MISNQLDPSAITRDLKSLGRIQIRDYLQPDAAEAIHQCLSREVPWNLAIRDQQGDRRLEHEALQAMSDQQQQELFRRLADEARGGQYRFAYDTYMMPRAYVEKRDPGLLLHRVLEFFNSHQYLTFVRQLTGATRIKRVDAQATRYRPGQFLRTHNDQHDQDVRLYAYVLNLSRRWQADWGGLLQFVDDEGQVIDTCMPAWNSLTLFKVPIRHHVSLVAPWAEEERLAVTGWLLATESARAAQQRTGAP